jgi:2-polyprenyl-3-methyl-5-hydroxy-6-metoxy-1,4-benzoquinol methylase
MVNLNNTFGAWAGHIAKTSIEKTVDYILTSASIVTANFEPTILDHIGKHENIDILDFGCGIGRNAIPLALSNKTWMISVYDNINMINQMKIFCNKKYNVDIEKIQNIKIYTDWNILKQKKFDFIYCTLVFQHIQEDALVSYTSDIKNMTKNLIVMGRRFNDDNNKNTWQILEKNGLYPVNLDTYKTCGDPNDHQTAIYKF